MPGALYPPGPRVSHALGFMEKRSWPPKYAALLSAAAAYSESQPVWLIHFGFTDACVAGNAMATSHGLPAGRGPDPLTPGSL